MKHLLTSLLVAAALFSCNTQKPEPTPTPPVEEAEIIDLTTAEFKEKVGDFTAAEWKFLGDKPVIVDIWATWCGPCKPLGVTLKEIAKTYKGKIQIYKVDCDEEPAVANAYKVEYLPTMLFIPMEGDPIMKVGVYSYSQVKKFIDEMLLAPPASIPAQLPIIK